MPPVRQRVALLRGPEDLAFQEIPIPEPGPGEVRVRIEATLVGGAETEAWKRGHRPRGGKLPGRFGHEGAGVVDAVGRGVTSWKVGDRVVPAGGAPCGDCAFCRRNAPALCESATPLEGLFASYVLVPSAIVSRSLHRVPSGLPAAHAALAWELACVLKGIETSPSGSGRTAVVLGVGSAGLFWVRVLSKAGAEVIAVDRRRDRLAKAKTLGAAHAVDAGEVDDVGQTVRNLTEDRIGADLVVEAVGSGEAIERAAGMARRGGVIHAYGMPPRGTVLHLPAERLQADEVAFVASTHHAPMHVAQALHHLASGFVDPAIWVEEEKPLARLGAVLARIATGNGPLKVSIV